MNRIKDILWDLWLPPWEGEHAPWLKFRATVMFHVRSVWFLWRKTRCVCPGCVDMTEMASASGMCWACRAEDCEHGEP